MTFLATVDESKGASVWAGLNQNWEITTGKSSGRSCEMQDLAGLAMCSPPCGGHCSAVVENKTNRQREEQLRVGESRSPRAFECLDPVIPKV